MRKKEKNINDLDIRKNNNGKRVSIVGSVLSHPGINYIYALHAAI